MHRFKVGRLLAVLALTLGGIILHAEASTGKAPESATPTLDPQPLSPIPILYLGEDGPVKQALQLTSDFILVTDPLAAQAVVLNGVPASGKLTTIGSRLQAGTGVVLIAGEELDESAVTLLLSSGITLQRRSEAVTLQPVSGVSDDLLHQINWNSAPQVRERTQLTGLSLNPLVKVYNSDEVIVGRTTIGQGSLYIVSPWLSTIAKNGKSTLANAQMRDWPYYNYFIYHLTMRAANGSPQPFADWAGSPMPHHTTRLVILIGAILLVSLNVGLFLLVRRYSQQHTEVLERLVASPETYHRTQKAQWEEVGLHRPLVGFLVVITTGLVLFVPLMIYQLIVLSGILLPSSQARGIWSLITQFFQVVWILFDMGTSTAFVKFFSEYRPSEPTRGIRHVQFYIWWQAITGTIQVATVALIAATIVPQMPMAYLSFYLIAHALIQFPGFLRVFQYLLRALQRTDYDQVLNIMATPLPSTMGILVMLIQPLAILAMRAWGAANPIFGEMMGGVFGLAVSFVLVELTFFGLGFWLYHRLGYQVKVVFMAHFDRHTARQMLTFGLPLTLAGATGSLGYTVQVSLTTLFLMNYAEIQGNWDVAFGLIVAYSALGGFYLNLMPAISEAFSRGRLALTRYYIAQGFRYGAWFSAFIASALLGVGDRFVLGGLGEEWVRAAQLTGIMTLWGAVQFPAWLSDKLQEGTGRPWMQFAMLIIEQTVRIVLMFLLVPSLQLYGLILAYCVALPLKDVLAWIWNYQVILRFRIHVWQTAIAPVLACLCNTLILRWIGDVIWSPNQVSSILLFLIGTVGTLPLYSFFSGLFGGWDHSSLQELAAAARLSPIAKPLGYVIYYPAQLGARFSPVHNRFPIPTQEARQEAALMTAEQVKLA